MISPIRAGGRYVLDLPAIEDFANIFAAVVRHWWTSRHGVYCDMLRIHYTPPRELGCGYILLLLYNGVPLPIDFLRMENCQEDEVCQATGSRPDLGAANDRCLRGNVHRETNRILHRSRPDDGIEEEAC